MVSEEVQDVRIQNRASRTQESGLGQRLPLEGVRAVEAYSSEGHSRDLGHRRGTDKLLVTEQGKDPACSIY